MDWVRFFDIGDEDVGQDEDEDEDDHDNDDDDDDDEKVGKVQTMCGRRGSWPDTPPPFLLVHNIL